jgi:hypothetical protein
MTDKRAGATRYATVNGAWPDGPLPKLDGPEAVAAAKRLYRFAMKRAWRGKWRITSGRRYTWPRSGVFYVNPYRGWHSLVHLLSHYCHRRLHPGVKPHDDMGRHAFLEREMIDYVVKSGWLEGKLKPKAKPKVPVQEVRYRRIIERIAAWQAKAKRAETALRKLRRQQRYYERKTA